MLVLKSAEAEARDVGRGIVRLDPADMALLPASIGDLVALEGRRTAYAKLLPALPERRSQRIVQMDGILRENARVGLGDAVTLRPAPACPPARRLVLRPAAAAPGAAPEDADSRYLGRILEGLPVQAGDTLRATLFGSRRQDYLVASTIPPSGPVLVTAQTEIQLQPDPRAAPAPAGSAPAAPGIVTYEDIGGLDRVLSRIREMIELPLKRPEIFRRLGIDPPRGVLLHGPPGTGKTLIARAVAHEAEARFFSVNGPEIVHKFYGESEAHLRKIFDEASRAAPAILFIDEIDAIAPRRSEVQGEVEKRIVATLLTLMDGLRSRGRLIVIGATNLPDALDPALRRPGRFDREIVIPVPDPAGRARILEIHTRGMPLAPDVDLTALAARTHGFVGADLEALAREAAMHCLRELVTLSGGSLDELPEDPAADLQVRSAHFLAALAEIEPSGLRDILVEIPKVQWSEIGGLDSLREMIRETIEWPARHPGLFAELRLAPPRGILLTGPPGVGKTLVAKAIATESGHAFLSARASDLVSKYLGESEKRLRHLFRSARRSAPCVLFFDELDTLLPARNSAESDSGVSARLLAQFLVEMDGIEDLPGVLVLAATNRPDLIDPAARRPGRFDRIIEIPLPGPEAREAILTIHLRGRPLAPDLTPAAVSALLPVGLSGAELAESCRRATLSLLRRRLSELAPAWLVPEDFAGHSTFGRD